MLELSACEIIPVIAPELVDDVQLDAAISIAASQVANNHCQRQNAIAYLAAHILTLAKRGGSPGSVASESEGSLSRAYSIQTGLPKSKATAALQATSYGMEVLRLNALCTGFAVRTSYSIRNQVAS